MIRVTISEEWRHFAVCLGDKKIGSIEGHKGYFCAYGLAKEGLARPYHGYHETLRRAMQSLLVAQGYGKSGPGYKVTLLDVA